MVQDRLDNSVTFTVFTSFFQAEVYTEISRCVFDRNVTEIHQKCQKHRENVGVQALFCSSTISVMFLANFSFKWQTNQTSQIKVLQKFVKPPSLKKGQQREMKAHIKNLQEI